MSLNEQDRRILKLLQADARISNQDLAKAVDMSTSACWRRVRSLEEAGIISGYRAVVDTAKAGFSFAAMVHVSLVRHEADHVATFTKRVQDRPEVLECFSTTGEADYHLYVVCRDKDAYNDFLEHFLFRLPGIANVRTNLVLKEVKVHGLLPV